MTSTFYSQPAYSGQYFQMFHTHNHCQYSHCSATTIVWIRKDREFNLDRVRQCFYVRFTFSLSFGSQLIWIDIWYNKWAGGDREDSYSNKVKSQTRCNVKHDTGLTWANTTGTKYICLFFARGCCPYGWECNYLHCLPDTTIDAGIGESEGLFWFVDYRDDIGGVGSYNQQNRTLYIGHIKGWKTLWGGISRSGAKLREVWCFCTLFWEDVDLSCSW